MILPTELVYELLGRLPESRCLDLVLQLPVLLRFCNAKRVVMWRVKSLDQGDENDNLLVPRKHSSITPDQLGIFASRPPNAPFPTAHFHISLRIGRVGQGPHIDHIEASARLDRTLKFGNENNSDLDTYLATLGCTVAEVPANDTGHIVYVLMFRNIFNINLTANMHRILARFRDILETVEHSEYEWPSVTSPTPSTSQSPLPPEKSSSNNESSPSEESSDNNGPGPSKRSRNDNVLNEE